MFGMSFANTRIGQAFNSLSSSGSSSDSSTSDVSDTSNENYDPMAENDGSQSTPPGVQKSNNWFRGMLPGKHSEMAPAAPSPQQILGQLVNQPSTTPIVLSPQQSSLPMPQANLQPTAPQSTTIIGQHLAAIRSGNFNKLIQ